MTSSCLICLFAPLPSGGGVSGLQGGELGPPWQQHHGGLSAGPPPSSHVSSQAGPPRPGQSLHVWSFSVQGGAQAAGEAGYSLTKMAAVCVCALMLYQQFTLVSQVRSALIGLKDLDLSDLRYLSDLTFNRLTCCTPHLRRLSLAGCHIAFEFDPYRVCPAGVVKDSSALLSLRNLKRFLTEQRSTMKVLDISRTSITPESLRTVAQVGKRRELSAARPQLLTASSNRRVERSHQL